MSEAHPRLRGDYSFHSDFSVNSQGSSPPARGLRGSNAGKMTFKGLIPACAGTTLIICV